MASQASSAPPRQSSWTKLVVQYQASRRWKGIGQLCSSFIPFLALWFFMYQSLHAAYWLTLILSLPAAGLLVRIFIIQHDCGHGSFFDSRKSNDFWGMVSSVLTLTPYHYWRKSHAIHHANAGKLSDRGIGDIYTMTVDEYLRSSRMGKIKYRLYRNPLILFVVLPTILFTVIYRLPSPKSSSLRPMNASIYATSLAIAGLAGILIWFVGLKPFFLIQFPITFISSSIGMWMFYVQHQFEDAYWRAEGAWEYEGAALHGSSFYALPGILRWFTGNIGFHHIHHLSPKIPNYRLKQCHDENPLFQDVTVLTLRTSLRSLSLRLWDEQRNKLVSFASLARHDLPAGSAP